MLYWNFSAVISYTDGTWGSVEVREENGTYTSRGEDITSHREVVEFFQQIGLTTKSIQEFPNINNIVFRFAATYFNSTIIVVSGIDEATIEGNNIPVIRTMLQTSQYFADYFLNGRILRLFGFETSGDFSPYFGLRISDEVNSQIPISYNSVLGSLNLSNYVNDECVLGDNDTVYYLNRFNNSFSELVKITKIEETPTLSYTVTTSDHFVPNSMESVALVGEDDFYVLVYPSGIYGISISGESEYYGEHEFVGGVLFGYNNELYVITGDSSIKVIVPGQSVSQISELSVVGWSGLTISTIYSANSVGNTVFLHCSLVSGESPAYYFATIDVLTGEISPLGTAPADFVDIYITHYDNFVISFIAKYAGPNLDAEGLKLFDGSYYRVTAQFGEGTQILSAIQIKTGALPDQVNSMSAAYNYDDEHIYLTSIDNNDVLTFWKYDLDTNELSNIELPTEYQPHLTQSYIGDGLNDMYDSGNMIATNISTVVPYTHTQQTDGEGPIALEDSSLVVNSHFGQGSSYFTAYHPGIFALFAMNIDIEEFRIYGELGADSGGTVVGGQFDLLSNDIEYTIYYKKVYNSDGPTVDHLIILPKKDGITHYFSGSGNLDTDVLYNVGQSDVLIYIVMSLGNDVTTEGSVYQQIAGQAIQAYVAANGEPEAIIPAWYDNAEIISGLFPSRELFYDTAFDYRITNLLFGSSSARICYIGNNQFFLCFPGLAFIIDANGNITNLNIGGIDHQTIRHVVLIGNDIYLLYRYFAVKVDVVNKTVSQNLQYNITTQPNHAGASIEEDTRMRSGLKIGDKTYLLLTIDGSAYTAVVTGTTDDSINLTLLHDQPSNYTNGLMLVGGPEITNNSIGLSSRELYCLYNMGFMESEEFSGTTIIISRMLIDRDITVNDLVIEHKLLEKMSDFRGEWNQADNFEILPLTDGSQQYTIKIPNLIPSGVIVVRMKYIDDQSDNWLYLRYD